MLEGAGWRGGCCNYWAAGALAGRCQAWGASTATVRHSEQAQGPHIGKGSASYDLEMLPACANRYEKARKLKDHIGKIRDDYTKNWEARTRAERQVGGCVWGGAVRL